jgi:small conductance mechanosensitive channel
MTEHLDKLIQDSSHWLPILITVASLYVLFWVLVWLSRKSIRSVCERLSVDEHLTLLFCRVAKIVLWIIGSLSIMANLGVEISALVTSLGLTGFALGFALKDTISNILAGVLVLLYRPFKIGDSIKISGFEGEVETIDLRYTHILQEGGAEVLIPNAKMLNDPIVVKAKECTE